MDNPLSIQATTPIQKRALSYSQTLQKLFNEIMSTKQPADRILAQYFRENKKHGSKDRKIIRETLFALFRWWGWLKKIDEQESNDLNWYLQLGLSGLFESHPWKDLISAWLHFAQLDIAASSTLSPFLLIDAETNLSTPINLQTNKGKLQLLETITSLNFQLTDLVPSWFKEVDVFQEDNISPLIEALSSRPPIWGRVQHLSTDKALKQLHQAGIEASSNTAFEDSIHLGNKNINLNGLPLYNQGQLEIQDLGSQVIGHICAPKPHENWWDACSGAGGKSLQLRSLMLRQDPKSTGKIIASDIRNKALEELNKRAKRAKFKGIKTLPWKNDALPVSSKHFDGVLVDSPCSCIGTWRRNPDLRWISDISAVLDKAPLQLDILSRSAQAVKLGGKLVYATCSLSSIENEEVVNAFLQAHPEFSLDTLIHPFTGKQHAMLTIWPFEANSDGMFVARMTRDLI
ncbi:RsmB/NOP family class I SAM-dependent RNA methyltransferase [Shewanella surugensis]|uniref:RsmB/NOP family class I SAM-dependent RNA methyltransferase n=1 Tax=Shewanella surugensis TaxID=212020 RepID=A0ABT0LFW9_9GAMM|nr:RsmB/NOP family class I SAM-dependent RNA methyltransferase [Shewanella surugensis]MCL1126051.1 RsmB/NOP family class I SAM-dependent RNA methyltransferase [Shewanella surugensis]